MPRDRSNDRRVRRTQGLLHGALASLIHEKAYDAIIVKEILARADVGRSTFYTHFRDKDALLDSGIRDVLRAGEMTPPMRFTNSAEWILRFSLPLFKHIDRYRNASAVSVNAEGQAVLHKHLRRVLAELIAGDLRRVPQHRRESGPEVPQDLLARHVASTFVLVLDWWMDGGEPLPPTEVNDLFRALVRPAVTGVVGPWMDARGG